MLCPVDALVAIKYGGRIEKIRLSVPPAQYATPRFDPPRGVSSPRKEWSCTQRVCPVLGSNASTRPIPFDAYKTPSTMIGVERSWLEYCRSGHCWISDASTLLRRHIISRSPTVSILIWSSDEYRVYPASPPWTCHSPVVPCCAELDIESTSTVSNVQNDNCGRRGV